jgi:hypothetical protein
MVKEMAKILLIQEEGTTSLSALKLRFWENIPHQGFAAASQEGRLRDERQALSEAIRRNEEMLAGAKSQRT